MHATVVTVINYLTNKAIVDIRLCPRCRHLAKSAILGLSSN